MTQTATDLASLIGSRICHDLISPIGAINNGLELWTMSGGDGSPEMGLIGESVGNASARIRFFRIAFGAAADQLVGPSEIQSIMRDVYDKSRLSIEWVLETPQPRAAVRLAFLAILCLESAMAYGGKIRVSEDHGDWTIEGSADRLSMDQKIWSVLTTEEPVPSLEPSHVQFALLPLVAKEDGRTIDVRSDANSVAIVF